MNATEMWASVGISITTTVAVYLMVWLLYGAVTRIHAALQQWRHRDCVRKG